MSQSTVDATPIGEMDYGTLKSQFDAVSADLALIVVAFMEGRRPGEAFTPQEIAEWVRAKRREER